MKFIPLRYINSTRSQAQFLGPVSGRRLLANYGETTPIPEQDVDALLFGGDWEKAETAKPKRENRIVKDLETREEN
ncbi:MAG: hypothetical protein VW907_02725 [Opitutae bacterium]